VTTYEYKEGTLILDLIEPAKKQLVWRATMVGTLEDSAQDNIERGNKAIAEAFESYPPGVKSK
jgi:acetaldehyde dehydrogenase (acetylating)